MCIRYGCPTRGLVWVVARVVNYCGIVYSGLAFNQLEGSSPMKLAQRKIKWLARLMLGLALFAQGIVAASACIAPSAGPVQAYSIVHDDEAAPCHDEELPNTNACLTHCTQADQISVDQHSVPVAAPASIIGWASLQPQVQHIYQPVTPDHPVLNTGPPLSVRFCSFQI